MFLHYDKAIDMFLSLGLLTSDDRETIITGSAAVVGRESVRAS